MTRVFFRFISVCCDAAVCGKQPRSLARFLIPKPSFARAKNSPWKEPSVFSWMFLKNCFCQRPIWKQCTNGIFMIGVRCPRVWLWASWYPHLTVVRKVDYPRWVVEFIGFMLLISHKQLLIITGDQSHCIEHLLVCVRYRFITTICCVCVWFGHFDDVNWKVLLTELLNLMYFWISSSCEQVTHHGLYWKRYCAFSAAPPLSLPFCSQYCVVYFQKNAHEIS